MYTSGSVGRPKAAIHSHRNLLAHGRNSILSHQPNSRRSLSACAAAVSHQRRVRDVDADADERRLGGGRRITFNVSRVLGLAEEYRCTWSAVVPTIVSQLLDWKDPGCEPRSPPSSESGSCVPLRRRYRHRCSASSWTNLKLRLIQAMGSSGGGQHILESAAAARKQDRVARSCLGFRNQDCQRRGSRRPGWRAGEILIRGPAVMQGYYKDPNGPPQSSTRRAGCTPATSRTRIRTATSSSSDARRN